MPECIIKKKLKDEKLKEEFQILNFHYKSNYWNECGGQDSNLRRH